MILNVILVPNSNALTKNQKIVIKQCKDSSNFFSSKNIEIISCGILGVESSFGLEKNGDNGSSFGVMQIQLSTANYMLKKQNIKLSNKDLKYLLISDNKFNLLIGQLYIEYLLKKFDNNINKAVLAFNVGPSNVRKYGLQHDPQNYLQRYDNSIKLLLKNHFFK